MPQRNITSLRSRAKTRRSKRVQCASDFAKLLKKFVECPNALENEIREYLTSVLDVEDPDQDAICLALLLYADVMAITGRHEEAQDLRACTSYTPRVPLWAIPGKKSVLARYQTSHVIGIGTCI